MIEECVSLQNIQISQLFFREDADALWNGRGRRPQRGRGPRLALTPRRTGRRSVWRGEDEAPPSRASKRANKDSRGWPSTRPFFCWSQTPQATRVFDPRAVGLPQVKAAGLVQTYGLQLPKKDMATPREAYRGMRQPNCLSCLSCFLI